MSFEIGRLVLLRGFILPIVGRYGYGIALLVEGNTAFMRANPTDYYSRVKDHHIIWGYDEKYIGKAVYCIFMDNPYLTLYEKKRCHLCQMN